jgi:cytochrome d ubiquinol oxidase subunit II
MRGISIELRGQSQNELWRALWDFVFGVASATLVLLLAIALGNVLRGFPLEGGMVVLPLFSDFTPSPPTGLLDWYTLAIAAFALGALARHGALYVAWKSAGDVRERCARVANYGGPVVIVMWLGAWAASLFVAHLVMRPLVIVFAITATVALAASFSFARKERYFAAFAASSAFLASDIFGIASATFPTLLRAIDDKASIDAYGASASPHALAVGSIWYIAGVIAVTVAFARQYRNVEDR